MVYIVTYATHSERYFDTLKQNCPGLIVLGYGEKWNGFYGKCLSVLEFCKSKDPDDVVCVIDGFDSIVLDSDIIEERYRELGKDLVFSKEGSVCGVIDKYLMDKIFSSCKSTRNRVNAGLYIGRTASIIEFWKDYKGGDDQQYVTSRCDQVYVDITHRIFYNYTPVDALEIKDGKLYKDSEHIPIMGAPGGRDMRPILIKLGYDVPEIPTNDYIFRSIKTYAKLFIPEIIWFVVTILLFLKIPNKKFALLISTILFLSVINFEVYIKHEDVSGSKKIVQALVDTIYVSSFPIILWLMVHSKNLRNIAILDILILSIMFIPMISIDTRIQYLYNKDAIYLDEQNPIDDNKILIMIILFVNVYSIWKLRNK